MASEKLFSPATAFWRVNREMVVSLAGSRALLMELSHPLVAAAVAAHSSFRRNRLGRLYRTARAAADMAFGTAAAAHRAAGHINRCHGQVHGTLQKSTGPFPPGTPYDADDSQLKLWVLATLIDSTLLVYDLFITPLSMAEKNDYYGGSKLLARLFGIAPETMPSSYEDFRAYMEAMLGSGQITVSDTARDLLQALFAPPLGTVARAASFAGIGLLPGRLREEYHFRWDEKRERRLRLLAALSRRIRPLLPSVLCVSPEALFAEWRHRRHREGSPTDRTIEA